MPATHQGASNAESSGEFRILERGKGCLEKDSKGAEGKKLSIS